MHAVHVHPAALAADDMLVLPMHKRMVAQYAVNESGAPELRLYYGTKEISFDEPELFAFGETLAKQAQFRAGDATAWGGNHAWLRIKELLEQLIAEGILVRAATAAPAVSPAADRARPSPLPPARSAQPRTWAECEAITRELTGHAVEPGYLELIIPIFRVAHISLDADNRQVGEGNVFPRALRLDRPTEWLACIYPGTRHQVDGRPMNATALKAMRTHWPQMMAALLRIRAAFLRRFPHAAEGLTVGHLERLATLVLSVPTYQLVRTDRPVANGALHPALSSLFRVTDGLRMVMHQMLFVPFGEPTLPPHEPMTSARIHDYAERNHAFHSETGVCAGPRNMVQEFLAVLVDGAHADKYADVAFEPAVAAALGDVEAAFDYGLYGLQAYAAIFSLWPILTRAYERLAEIATAAVADGIDGFRPFDARLRAHVTRLRTNTFLAKEAWRADRETVYADMYEQCGRGLASHDPAVRLVEQIAPVRCARHGRAEARLRSLLKERFSDDAASRLHVERLVSCLMDVIVREQAILRLGSAVQAEINRLLGRTPPMRPFGSAEVNVHSLLVGGESHRLPYLLDELKEALGIAIAIDPRRIEIEPTDVAEPY
jgi:hypothetical protein